MRNRKIRKKLEQKTYKFKVFIDGTEYIYMYLSSIEYNPYKSQKKFLKKITSYPLIKLWHIMFLLLKTKS